MLGGHAEAGRLYTDLAIHADVAVRNAYARLAIASAAKTPPCHVLEYISPMYHHAQMLAGGRMGTTQDEADAVTLRAAVIAAKAQTRPGRHRQGTHHP